MNSPLSSMESTMSATAHAAGVSRAASTLSLIGRAFGRSRSQRLDVAALPEHLKRDLGFLGGRETVPRNIFRD